MAYIKSYSSSKEQCNRKYMEDYYNIFFCFENDCWIFNVCDGHGGFEVAEFINKNFNKIFINEINTLKKKYKIIEPKTLKTVLIDIIEELDKEIEKLPCAEFTGSTFASVIYYNNNLYFVNIGDSNIICNMKPPYFNKLHVPTDKIEKSRIIKSSFIENDRIEGMINLSRAFGDFRFKRKNKNTSPMISTPDIDIIDIRKVYEYNNIPWMLLSSDGLLILFTREEISKIVNIYLKYGYDCDYIVKLLMAYCCFYNNDDNVTILLICLNTKQSEIPKSKLFMLIKNKIRKQCHSILKEQKKIKWKKQLQIIKENIIYEFKDFENLNYIYKLLEFEVISKIPQIKNV